MGSIVKDLFDPDIVWDNDNIARIFKPLTQLPMYASKLMRE